MYIASLTVNEENIDTILYLKKNKYINKLTIMLSAYFYSHYKNTTCKYLLDKLDCELLIIRNHAKIILIDVNENIKIVITGSANLRSSMTYEQIEIIASCELYNYYLEFFNNNIKYKVG